MNDFKDSDPSGRDHPEVKTPPSWVFLDTETNKLPDYKLPADHPDQPRLAAMTLIYCSPDLTAGTAVTRLIKPDGWVMHEEAGAINGLTTEKLADLGVPVREALDIYTASIREGRAVAAFGAQFDCKIMRGELRRAEMDDLFELTKNFCVMRKLPMKDIKKLNGKGGWPGLVDACAHYGVENSGPHTSIGDSIAGLQIMRKLRDAGVDLTPMIHYAKKEPERKPGSGKLTDKDVRLQDGDTF